MAWRNGGTAFNDIITTLRMKVMIHSAEDKIPPQYGICSESVTNLSFLYQSQIHSTRNQRIKAMTPLTVTLYDIPMKCLFGDLVTLNSSCQSTTKANKSVITLAKINIPDHEGKLYSYHPLETRKKLFGMQGILIICIQIL